MIELLPHVSIKKKEPEDLTRTSEDTESLKKEIEHLRQKTQKQDDDIELLKSLLFFNKRKARHTSNS